MRARTCKRLLGLYREQIHKARIICPSQWSTLGRVIELNERLQAPS
jgi:hypothetical protein